MKIKIVLSKTIVVFVLPLLVLLSACKRNTDLQVTVTYGDSIMVSGSVRGTVIDENNQPVANATVTSGGSTTTTDRYGVFRFSNINLSKENGYVKVNRQGYFTGIRTFVSTAGRTHNVRIRLIPKINSGTFSGTTGGTITLSGGGKLVMPSNALTDASGNAYTGVVNVAMTWIDPTFQNLPEIVPGDLRGITTAGEERGLETYGMLGVEMTGAGGQALKIATGKTAELTFPIPAAFAGTAPATIDLWHFDEATGRWKQEGAAIKTGSNYKAEVSHFSFWNCDAPFPLVNLCMSFVNYANNQALNNVQIRIKRANGSYGSGWTDSAGNLCGKVPKNETLTLQVMDQCNNSVYSQPIGPFSTSATLPTIAATLPATSTLTITGTVTNCAGTNITNGAVVIYTDNAFSYSVPVVNGVFLQSIIVCGSAAINFSVTAVDYTTGQQSGQIGGSGANGTISVGAVQACSTATTDFVELLVAGNPINFMAPPDSIVHGFDIFDPRFSQRIQAYKMVNGQGGINTVDGFYITYPSLATIPGTFPIESFGLRYGSDTGQNIVSPNPTINIVSIGQPVLGFIEGNFNIQVMFGLIPKNVVGNFRVRRRN